MKKILTLGAVFVVTSSLMAKVSTVLPYIATIDYGNDSTKSVKDRATLFGIHASQGDLSHLVEIDYSHIKTKYKDRAITDLSQDDISLAYGKYFPKFMYKVGLHYISTNDDQLNNAIVAITSVGGYKYIGYYDKVSYGLEGYYSYYKDGHDENYVAKKIGIFQATPYISYHKAINVNSANTFVVKGNFEYSSDYVKHNYASYEVSDTLFYKKFFTTLKVYGGEMRSGVKDGGFTVYNTLDLMKRGGEVKVGYYIKPNIVADISYGVNKYSEYDVAGTITADNTNSVAVASLSYSY